MFTTEIPKISSIADLRYHFSPFRRDVAYDAISSDKSMPDFPLLYAKIAKVFSIFLRDHLPNSVSIVNCWRLWKLTVDN